MLKSIFPFLGDDLQNILVVCYLSGENGSSTCGENGKQKCLRLKEHSHG